MRKEHPLPEGMESGIPRSIRPMATTRLLSPFGKARAAAEVLLPKAGTGGADESVDSFIRRRFGASARLEITGRRLRLSAETSEELGQALATPARERSFEGS